MCGGVGTRGKVNLSFVKVRGTQMHYARRSRPPSYMMAQEEIPEEPVKEAQIQPEEELKEIDLGTESGSQKPVFISGQLVAQGSN